MIGCRPRSFSSDAASVEKPVFVFFCGCQPELVEQHRAQLLGGVDRERMARQLLDLGLELADLVGQAVDQPLEVLGVDAHADVLHAGQHPHQRPLDVVVEAAGLRASSAGSAGRDRAGPRPAPGGRHRRPGR